MRVRTRAAGDRLRVARSKQRKLIGAIGLVQEQPGPGLEAEGLPAVAEIGIADEARGRLDVAGQVRMLR